MRHRNSGRKFNKTSSHRKALFSNLTCALLKHEIIQTTLPKAKELRVYAEPLITLSKNDSVAKRRIAFSKLHDREIVTKLFENIGPRFKERSGGYLSVIKCGFREGDNAHMAYIELVDRA